MRDLGQVYSLKNQMETTEIFTNKALTLFQQDKHRESYRALENLAEIYLKKSMQTSKEKGAQQYKEQAIAYLKEALEIVKMHFPENSPQRIRIQEKFQTINLN